jgi:hypothetical protein
MIPQALQTLCVVGQGAEKYGSGRCCDRNSASWSVSDIELQPLPGADEVSGHIIDSSWIRV